MLQLLEACRSAGLQLCSGGIMGMGETADDLIDMAFALKEMNVESIPLNFLNSIDGTPLEGVDEVSPRDCLRGLAMMRLDKPLLQKSVSQAAEKSTLAACNLSVYMPLIPFLLVTTSPQKGSYLKLIIG